MGEDAILNEVRLFVQHTPEAGNGDLYDFMIALGLEHEAIEGRFPLIARARDAQGQQGVSDERTI